MFIVNAKAPDDLTAYLQQQQWISEEEEIVALTVPGEGNMNCVLRIQTNSRSFIIKQSRGYVEKYPQIAAPATRVVTEGAFYQKIASDTNVQDFMPKLLGVDVQNNIIALEDLGDANDYTVLYEPNSPMNSDALQQLVQYISALHHNFQKTVVDEELANTDMRTLNYEHIFEFPFRVENGFDLDTVQEGLQKVALTYKQDTALKREVERLGALYLSKGKYLLHGDYYPGSWLKTADGCKVIDPEFCFYGLREFDLGVLLAHLYLTQQEPALIEVVKENYALFGELNTTILNGFIGTEIMRRLIGIAQLPLKMDLNAKASLLAFARKLIVK